MLMPDFEVLDPRFRRYAMQNVHMETLYTGTRWAEGPVYCPAGKYLLWSDIPNDRILRYDETSGAVSVFASQCGFHNGHTCDREGRLVSCEHQGRRVSRIEHDGSVTTLAELLNARLCSRRMIPREGFSMPMSQMSGIFSFRAASDVRDERAGRGGVGR